MCSYSMRLMEEQKEEFTLFLLLLFDMIGKYANGTANARIYVSHGLTTYQFGQTPSVNVGERLYREQ